MECGNLASEVYMECGSLLPKYIWSAEACFRNPPLFTPRESPTYGHGAYGARGPGGPRSKEREEREAPASRRGR